MLRKYIPDPSHVIQYMEVLIQENVTYEEQLVRILGRELKVFRNREISLPIRSAKLQYLQIFHEIVVLNALKNRIRT